ncbi:cilia- and flagella-associated protein 20-like [Ctenocephalides felis]|uniref:cilia- and flagella-associated protein 20-like n=1 Tax=Ctenocephalides felis TaxID=7515 RepID=UPI000E6E1BB1|nr:cilia- and flagella-associated protein 20-like [Ctenocephalides felis]
MFRNTYQSGFLSILFSIGGKPLAIWDKKVQNGHIKRVTDEEVHSLVLEIMGTNVATTYITTPVDPRGSLGIRLPFLVMIVKNMKKYFSFEITILDDKDMHRRFRVSNFQSTTRVGLFCTCMPIGLSGGWNQIQFNLADFTRRAYGSNYLETSRMQIHANIRIRRVYFCDRLYSEDEKPQEFKLYLPVQGTKKSAAAEPVMPSPAAPSPVPPAEADMVGIPDDNRPKQSKRSSLTSQEKRPSLTSAEGRASGGGEVPAPTPEERPSKHSIEVKPIQEEQMNEAKHAEQPPAPESPTEADVPEEIMEEGDENKGVEAAPAENAVEDQAYYY